MALTVKIPLPDIYIQEYLEYKRITEKKDRTTTGQFQFENTDTLASYDTTSTAYDNQGELGMGLLLYNVSTPKLIDYIYDDSTYGEMKTMIEDNESDILINISDIAEVEKEVDLLKTFPTVTGTANAIILATPTDQDFDYAVDGNPIVYIPTASNTGASTVKVDTGAVVDILKPDGVGGTTAVEADDLPIGVPITLHRRVSGNFFLLSPKGGATIKSLQKGSVTLGNPITVNVPISTVDLNSTVLIFSYNAGTQPPEDIMVLGKLTSATNIQFQILTTTGNANDIRWQVVEFNNVKSVQRGETVLSRVTNGVETNNVSISSVDTTKTLIFLSAKAEGGASVDASFSFPTRGELTTNTNLKVTSGIVANDDKTVYWQAIEFK